MRIETRTGGSTKPTRQICSAVYLVSCIQKWLCLGKTHDARRTSVRLWFFCFRGAANLQKNKKKTKNQTSTILTEFKLIRNNAKEQKPSRSIAAHPATPGHTPASHPVIHICRPVPVPSSPRPSNLGPQQVQISSLPLTRSPTDDAAVRIQHLSRTLPIRS